MASVPADETSAEPLDPRSLSRGGGPIPCLCLADPQDRWLVLRWRAELDVAIGSRGRVQALAGAFFQSWLNWRTPDDIMMEAPCVSRQSDRVTVVLQTNVIPSPACCDAAREETLSYPKCKRERLKKSRFLRAALKGPKPGPRTTCLLLLRWTPVLSDTISSPAMPCRWMSRLVRQSHENLATAEPRIVHCWHCTRVRTTGPFSLCEKLSTLLFPPSTFGTTATDGDTCTAFEGQS